MASPSKSRAVTDFNRAEWFLGQAMTAARLASDMTFQIPDDHQQDDSILCAIKMLAFIGNTASYMMVLVAYLMYFLSYLLTELHKFSLLREDIVTYQSTMSIVVSGCTTMLFSYATVVLSYFSIFVSQLTILSIPTDTLRMVETNPDWTTPARECSVHLDTIEDGQEVITALSQTCTYHHDWWKEIICVDCLKQHLHTQMFPHESENKDVKYKFPSMTVKCWAPGCPATLTHHVVQKYADYEVFRIYDLALCQRSLHDLDSIMKCATLGCPGAEWIDPVLSANSKIFLCPVCHQQTCRDCDDLYDRHLNLPCPATERKKRAKFVLEEAASENVLRTKDKCPRCPVRYERISGCDQITCGKNAHSSQRSGGCSFKFCHLCKGEWKPDGHMMGCIYHKRA